ncbi:MAG: cation diffusion facilitator family transporter, partial [Candidatus Sericytochromatia bacterium]|nr:cation diffusion facilitator family transporter [Candidatus Sericytochromatia bacterium]
HHHLTGRKLASAFFASFGVLAVLLAGAWFSGSLALMADAGHVVTDIAALGLSWYGAWQATRPPDHRRTFGYHRTGILAALFNALSLFAIAAWIAWEAWHRLQGAQAIATLPMGLAATVGMALNLVIGFTLHDHAHGNLNVRSAYLHVIGDAAASAGVIVGAVLIWATGWAWVDPALSVAIAGLIAYGAWHIVEESLEILMEGVPSHLDLQGLARDLAAIEGVVSLHDLHVWSIARDLPSLSCHILIAESAKAQGTEIVAACNRMLAERWKIHHTTIQAEAVACSTHAGSCQMHQA